MYKLQVNSGSSPWINLGRPYNNLVYTVFDVRVGGPMTSVYVTVDNIGVCRYREKYRNFQCFGVPNIATSIARDIAISKPVWLQSCSNWSGQHEVVFLHERNNMRSISVRPGSVGWLNHMTPSSCCNFNDAPEVFLSGGCPKTMSSQKDGSLYERFFQ